MENNNNDLVMIFKEVCSFNDLDDELDNLPSKEEQNIIDKELDQTEYEYEDEDDLPYELTYNCSSLKRIDFDWEKVKYNQSYKDFNYVASRFPQGWYGFTGFATLIQNLADEKPDLLEEYELQKNKCINNNE